MSEFRTSMGEHWFQSKYAMFKGETWAERCRSVVEAVCSKYMSRDEMDFGIEMMRLFKWLPGGRYIYYGGRKAKYFNNCYLLLGKEDTREEWARIMGDSASCLLTGGGIGVDYSVFRERGRPLGRTGGTASGPIPLMHAVNDFGRRARQGGGRRSAIYASLDWNHGDAREFLTVKDWKNQQLWPGGPSFFQAKMENFDADAPLDMTNISFNYDDAWLSDSNRTENPIFKKNIEMAMRNGEPGFSFNFGKYSGETGRNAPLAGDTQVLTLDGYRPIVEIANQLHTVWTGKRWADTTFTMTSKDAEIIEVGITGGRTIKAEPSHEFFVDRFAGKGKTRVKLGTIKVAAEDLNVGDVLHVSSPDYDSDSLVDGPIAYMLGFAYGDGSFYKSSGEITFCTQDKLTCFESMDRSLFTSVTSNDSRGYTRAYFGKAYAAGRRKSEFPEEMEGSPSFIAGLFDADGHCDADRDTLRLASVNYDFLVGVRRSLDTMGILSSITTAGLGSYKGTQTYSLGIMASSTARFRDIIPTVRLKPEGRIPYRESHLRVVRLTPGVPEDVYCCDVGVEEHSFMAEGVIVSNCTEVTSSDDSDVCNLASPNLARIDDVEEFMSVSDFVGRFCICGSLEADVPYDRVRQIREKNRRIGQGIMGYHEWLLQRNYRYEYNHEIGTWLTKWEGASENGANTLCDQLGISRPVAYRAIAPTGTIAGLAGTTSGIEPIFAVAYKRRWLDGETRKYQYYIDHAAQTLIDHGLDPDKIEGSIDLAEDVERRLSVQYHIQQHVDMAISSTINLPAWGTELNNKDRVDEMARLVSEYAPGLRGLTFYPDGARGGQPLSKVDYAWAKSHQDVYLEEETNDACLDGVCGI